MVLIASSVVLIALKRYLTLVKGRATILIILRDEAFYVFHLLTLRCAYSLLLKVCSVRIDVYTYLKIQITVLVLRGSG